MIKTNANMEALDGRGNPIPGLYAVGGVCSPINGQIYTHRCAGSRATFALLGGRIVSEHLPEYLQPSENSNPDRHRQPYRFPETTERSRNYGCIKGASHKGPSTQRKQDA